MKNLGYYALIGLGLLFLIVNVYNQKELTCQDKVDKINISPYLEFLDTDLPSECRQVFNDKYIEITLEQFAEMCIPYGCIKTVEEYRKELQEILK